MTDDSPDKSLPPTEEARVRDLLLEIVEKDFAGNKSAAAREIGVSQSFISEIYKQRRGAGNKLLRKLANYTGRSIDSILHGGTATDYSDSQEGRARPELGFHRDFERVWDEFWRRFGDTEEYTADLKPAVASASFGTGVPEFINWQMVKGIADAEVQARRLKREKAAKQK